MSIEACNITGGARSGSGGQDCQILIGHQMMCQDGIFQFQEAVSDCRKLACA